MAAFLPRHVWGSRLFTQEPLHSTTETIGALAAISTAILLLRREPDDAAKAVPAAISFLGMGILDGVHALSLPGQGFVLLHSLASLAGALGFMLAWVPEERRRSRPLFWTRKLPPAVAAAALVLGLTALLRPAIFPAMLRGREFSAAGVAVNGAAGVLFLLSAIPFLVRARRLPRREEFLFGSMAVLFGAAELVVPFSELWDAQWWYWHAVRLAAYGVALWLSQSYVAGLRAAEQVARRQAEQATRAREDLLAVVSHDLRSPLSAITLSATMLSSAAPSPGDGSDSARKAAETILRSADHMSRLISDLLDAAQIEAGKLSIAQATNDAAALVGEAVEMIRPVAENKRLAMRQQVARGLPPVLSDRERVLQVLTNLLGNAVKFTPEGGAITVMADGEGEAVRFAVADTGVGIPPDALPHLFDRYWQARHAGHAGAGLGLFIAKGIVEAHGGRLWAESVPDRGSTFSFTLPTAGAPEDHRVASVP